MHPIDERSRYGVDDYFADVAKDQDQGGDHGVLALLGHDQNGEYAQEPVADAREDPARQEEKEISSDIRRNHRATLMTTNRRECDSEPHGGPALPRRDSFPGEPRPQHASGIAPAVTSAWNALEILQKKLRLA